MEALSIAGSLLPEKLSSSLAQYSNVEEIRLRCDKKPGIIVGGKEYILSEEKVEQSTLLNILERATGASLHAAVPSLRTGFITYKGLRIGVCGEAVYAGQDLKMLRNISSLTIRIPHELTNNYAALIESLLRPSPTSTLIAAPPGAGKTSFLRELIRRAGQLYRVSVIDERNELSASVSGHAQFDLGFGSDILIGVAKEKAAVMLLRGMNPQIIAMDEITAKEDIRVLEDLAGCGVTLFATAHGRDTEDMKKRPVYRLILESGIFQELVKIQCYGGKRIYTREALK